MVGHRRDYREEIIAALEGRAEALKDVPAERLDWEGVTRVYDLHDAASGHERAQFIASLDQIVRDAHQREGILAQVVQIATSLDLAELEPSIRGLSESDIQAPALQEAVDNYLAMRRLKERAPIAALSIREPREDYSAD